MNGKRYRFGKEEDGATAVEYALMAASIAGVVAIVVAAIGGQVLNMFQALVGIFP